MTASPTTRCLIALGSNLGDRLENLRAGRLVAALDVFEHEPLPADSPLRHMDNVMLSPHNTNSSPRHWDIAAYRDSQRALMSALADSGRPWSAADGRLPSATLRV